MKLTNEQRLGLWFKRNNWWVPPSVVRAMAEIQNRERRQQRRKGAKHDR